MSIGGSLHHDSRRTGFLRQVEIIATPLAHLFCESNNDPVHLNQIGDDVRFDSIGFTDMFPVHPLA